MTTIVAEAAGLHPTNETLISKATRALTSKKDRASHRLQLELPPRSMERLVKLKENTEAASHAEVIRNAIRLYEAMVSEAKAGREFFIKDPSGTIMPYKVFLEA